MFSAYTRILNKYPLLTKMITSGVLFSFGDAITQVGKILLILSNRQKIKNRLQEKLEPLYGWNHVRRAFVTRLVL